MNDKIKSTQDQSQEPLLNVEQSSSHLNADDPGKGEKPLYRKSSAGKLARRLIILIAILALAVIGYVKREVIFKADAQSPDQSSASEAKPELKVLYWQDPMHPAYKSDKPGKAPDCGMDLVPVYEGGQTATNLPEGAFQISPEKQQLIGVTFGEVAYRPVSKTIRAVARLAYDETKIVRIHTKVEGWVEDVFVDFTGKLVEKGQPLVSIYSPELVQTQQEYLLAIRGRNELSESPFGEAVRGAESLYESARKRLELWDITEEQIKELEKRGKPIKAMTLYAPTSGFVLARNAYPKQRITPETELYSIADLSTVWAIADIYEYEAPEIREGQAATMTLSYYPGRPFRGRVTYIYPQLDSATRTLKVRIEFPNQNFALKPDMYANVDLSIDYGKKLVVPQEAVLDSGSEQMVFVSLEGGYFEPRKVQLGAKVDNTFIVLAGLKAGEKIATSANFLIDSESRLKSAAGGMGMPGMSHGGGAPAGGKQSDHSQHKQEGQPSPDAKPEDHSQHQQAAPQTKQEDHSGHQPKEKKKPDPQVEDHSRHKPDAEDHSGHVTEQVDHSQHKKPERKVLYWYDPMHPAYKSDKPGKAPDCGMDLVPKYADEKK
ncbi:MAG: efflux RND transporter periplasmic adaptor subunit [Acidobacteriota bacterium]